MNLPRKPWKPRFTPGRTGLDDGAPAPSEITARDQCLEQLLEAFRDIADRDDIHQAADRLKLALAWIRREAECAADDPVFARLKLAS